MRKEICNSCEDWEADFKGDKYVKTNIDLNDHNNSSNRMLKF